MDLKLFKVEKKFGENFMKIRIRKVIKESYQRSLTFDEAKKLFDKAKDLFDKVIELFADDPAYAFEMLVHLKQFIPGLQSMETVEDPSRVYPTVILKFNNDSDSQNFAKFLMRNYHEDLFQNPDLSNYRKSGNTVVFEFQEDYSKLPDEDYYQ